MPLTYALFENNLTSDPDDYTAVVQSETSKTMDDIITLMSSRGSTVTKAEIYGVMEEYALAMEMLLRDGYSINTPLFKIRPSVGGVFNGSQDVFDKSRHYVKFNVTLASRLKEIEGEVAVQKEAASEPRPLLIEFTDIASGTKNATLTPGSVGQLHGSQLKFDPADAKQGIFFASGGVETKVTTVVKLKPAELIFMIPALPAGSYTLTVKTRFRTLKDLREGSLNTDLIVT